MAATFPKAYLLTYCVLFSHLLFAREYYVFPNQPTIEASYTVPPNSDSDRFEPKKPSNKICSCQILVLESNHLRQRNFALLAERTNSRSLRFDMSAANKVLEKEKRHMHSYFYDKLEVVGNVFDETDCRSLFKKLKSNHKRLFLYDILDADIRR